MAKLARSFELFEPLRDRIKLGMPVFGTCAGMILLADRVDTAGSPLDATIGGIDMTVRRNAFGRQVDSFEGDIAFAGLGEKPLHGVFIRAPWVEDCGDGVDVLATVDPGDGAPRIVAVRQGALLATSFHPELIGDTRVHALFAGIVEELR
jgi:5'-phosphate synthase pdxT subunit